MELWALRWEGTLTESEQNLLMGALPPQRRERFLRIQNRDKQIEMLCAYGLLQQLLLKTYGWRELPAIAYTDHGKPWFPDAPHIHFSLSHTDGAVLAGISESVIGVDIEKIRPAPPRVQRHFGEMKSDRAFWETWVCLEAVSKRDGFGLQSHPEMMQKTSNGYSILETFEGYVAGVAVSEGKPGGNVEQMTLAEVLRMQKSGR